ncbi:MAG: hypothetical protein CSA75_02895 [Sorangium cellulosum]|nr:MAG: hypothetical protein CSA75_02895 [Sorangium cellulosum]
MKHRFLRQPVSVKLAGFFVVCLVLIGCMGTLPGPLLNGLAQGARAWLAIVLPAVAISLIVGVWLGMIAAQVGGLGDRMITRALELIGGFPTIVFVALVASMTPDASFWLVVVTLSLIRIPETVRLVRLQTVRYRSSEPYMAARAIGASPFRIFARHLIPAMAGNLGATALTGVGVIVGVEAAMSFVGLSTPYPGRSWGKDIGEAMAAGKIGAALCPALALCMTMLALYRLAVGLRDAFNPNEGQGTDRAGG